MRITICTPGFELLGAPKTHAARGLGPLSPLTLTLAQEAVQVLEVFFGL